MSLGLAVTWDNPDIELRRGDVPISSSEILSDTDYEIVARIWNGSTDAPIVNLPVYFSYLEFGIGTIARKIDGGRPTYVDLGVKGGPDCPAFAQKAPRFCQQYARARARVMGYYSLELKTVDSCAK